MQKPNTLRIMIDLDPPNPKGDPGWTAKACEVVSNVYARGRAPSPEMAGMQALKALVHRLPQLRPTAQPSPSRPSTMPIDVRKR
jgi:hypothetical protein